MDVYTEFIFLSFFFSSFFCPLPKVHKINSSTIAILDWGDAKRRREWTQIRRWRAETITTAREREACSSKFPPSYSSSVGVSFQLSVSEIFSDNKNLWNTVNFIDFCLLFGQMVETFTWIQPKFWIKKYFLEKYLNSLAKSQSTETLLCLSETYIEIHVNFSFQFSLFFFFGVMSLD